MYVFRWDPKHFKNPGLFNPDRFLDDQGQFVNDDHVIPFSIGKRYCLGQSLAEKEFFLFFAGMMQKFEFIQVPGSTLPGYGEEDVQCKSILRNTPFYEVILKPRGE